MADDRGQRRFDFQRGLSQGRDLFAGKTGRLGKDEDIKTVLAKRREQLQGFTPAEQEQFRSNISQSVNRSTQGNLRQLQALQGRTGIRGGVAAQQAGDVLQQGQDAQVRAEKDLQLQNIGEQRRALGALEQSAGDVAKFDIGQESREKFGALATALAEQQAGVTERSADKASRIAAAQAAQSSGGGGKK